MKVKLLKQSMSPVDEGKFNAMMDEYKSSYDTIIEESRGDMKKAHEGIDKMIEVLHDKYKGDRELEVDLPKTGKAWSVLLDKYGTIALGTNIDSGKLCLMILDNDDAGIAP